MKWNIPAKTFLLGEYAALSQASAILLTTTPYFELSLIEGDQSVGIHPLSPAGRFWKAFPRKSLSWYDPYQARGGLGASSAQFLGSYWAQCHLRKESPHLASMLKAYEQASWSGTGLKPSGYDVLAQSQGGCVYIHLQKKVLLSYDWPFEDLSCFLLATGVKVPTHQHLQSITLPASTQELSDLVEEGKEAFDKGHSQQLIQAVNDYHQKLKELNLVAPHSLDFIQRLKHYPEVLALKGCGALGADVILLLTSRHQAPVLKEKLRLQCYNVLATEQNITNAPKTLEILL